MAGEASTRLDHQVRDRGALPHEKATQIAEEVLAQIELLAQRGELRALSGISLSRILLSPNGQVVLLRPTDELPAVVSAPAYAAPEEIRGDSPSVQSAIYSLGCALFELLTGRPPFLGKDPKAVLRAHLSAPAPDLTALRPDLPAGLSAAVASFLAKDPARRPLDATHAIGVLRAALGRPAETFSLPQVRSVPTPPAGARVAPRPPSVPGLRSAPGRRGPVNGRSASPAARPAVPISGRPTAGTPSARAAAGPAPARRPGEGPAARGTGARPGIHRSLGGPAPPKATWIFTWSGLGLGVFISLFCVATVVMKSQAPPSLPAELTKEEKESIVARRAGFRRAVAEEEELALREFKNLPTRVSFAERAAKIKELLDRFHHTRAAREMAETLTLLRGQAAEAAANPQRHEAEPEAGAPAVAPAAAPAAGEGPAVISPVDGIELPPGPKDDGKTDL